MGKSYVFDLDPKETDARGKDRDGIEAICLNCARARMAHEGAAQYCPDTSQSSKESR